MSHILKNNTGVDVPLEGRVVPASGQLEIDPANLLDFATSDDVISLLSDGTLTYNDGTSDRSLSDALDHIKGYQQKFVVTEDNRQMIAANRIPAGYSLYVCGASDDISGGVFGGGDDLKLTAGNPSRDFRQLKHYYIIGARGIWENCNMDQYVDAMLYAPASTGLTQQTGDFTKVNVGGPYNIIIPTAAGQGDWDIDLTAKIGSSNVLACTPVPAAGNVGWFDYDSNSNVITPNLSQEGGYNLYDFDVNLHAFARKLWGSAMQGGMSELDVTELIGKKLYSFWSVKFTLTGAQALTNQKLAIILILGAQGNV